MKTIFAFLPLLFSITFGYSQCIADTLPPTVICNNITVALSSNGTSLITPSQIDNGSSDNCGIASLLINGQSSHTFSCIDLGNQIVTLIATDSAGNSNSCVATITVIDTMPPTVVCKNDTISLSATGTATATPLTASATIVDNCGISTALIDGQPSMSFSCADLGINTVTLMVIDANGNSNSCTSIINVIDPLPICALSTNAISQTKTMVKLYPNPVSKTLTIESKNAPLQQLRLTTLTGQLLLDKNITNSPNTVNLDVSNFPNAVYLLTITIEDNHFTEKIILQK